VLIVYLLLQNMLVFGQFNNVLDIAFGVSENPNLYVPDNGDHLGLWEKYDFKISVDHHDINTYNRYDAYSSNRINQFKLGFSPLSNIYTTASYVRYQGDTFLWPGLYEEKMIMGDVGVGGDYAKLDAPSSRMLIFKKKRKWMMDRGVLINGLIGFSKGRMTHQKTYGFGKGEFNFNRIYGQFGLHLQRSLWGISANLKFGRISYNKSSLIGHASIDLVSLSDFLQAKNNFFFLESSFRVFLGTRFGQVYINLVQAQSDASFEEFIKKDYVNVGAVLDIEGIFKKKK